MSEKIKTRAARFRPHELESLKSIVLEIISRNKTRILLPPVAWRLITEKFNEDRNNSRRTTRQLQHLWRGRLIKEYPSYRRSVRSEELQPRQKESSSQNTRVQEECKEMDGLHNQLIRAMNLPISSDICIGVDDIQDVNEIEDPITSNLTNSSVTFYSHSMTSPEPVSRPNHGISKLTTNVEVFQEEYHTTRMAKLREEHQLTMKGLEDELQYWRRMNYNAAENTESQPSLQDTPVIQTYHLFSGISQDLWSHY